MSPFSSEQPRWSALKVFLPFLRPYRRQAAAALLALAMAAGAVLAIGLAVRQALDQGFDDAEALTRAFLFLFGLVAVLAAATYARFSLVTWLGERVVADIRKAAFARAASLGPLYYDATPTGAVLSRLTTDAELIQTLVGSSLSLALRNAILFVGGLAMLFVTSPVMTAMVMGLVPLVIAPIVILGRRVRGLSRAGQDRIADLTAQAGEVLGALPTVQSFAQEEREARRFARLAEEVFALAARRIRARAGLTALVMLLVFGAVDFVLWMGGLRVLDGRMSAGELGAFLFYAIVVAGAVGAISEVWGEVQRAAGASERLASLLSAQRDYPRPAVLGVLPHPPRGHLIVEDVSFRYPSRAELSLDGVSFEIKPGERVALVGPSGAGKSTLFHLIQGFYRPARGRILFDGVDIAQVEPQALRARLGVVAQDATIFGRSAGENIAYGRPDADGDAIVAAAQAAQADEFIRALPQGYDTFLGERGVRLSGGQRQRIAIARAILRDPALLLLDEATSALDAESLMKVQAALDRLMEGRSALVIAHRLATVVRSDRIILLNGGRLAGEGPHGRLIEESPLYARLASLEFSQV